MSLVMSAPTHCSGLADLAARYSSFIVDQWGVLHDGEAPYPDAIDCLKRLRAASRRIVLLSNSGKRASVNAARLRAMGIGDDLYDAVVTSGEAAWTALAERTDPFFAGLGRHCILWARYGDRSVVDGLPLEVADSVDDAEFILLAGTEDHMTLDHFAGTLELGARRGLPMVCANPDVVAVRPGGGFGMAPGAVARRYEELGGRVGYVGKPHRPVYELCLAHLGRSPVSEIVAVGDSLAHDVAGAAAMGIDAALVVAGIHADDLDLEMDRAGLHAALARLREEHGVLPRWLLPRFRWSDG
jgi:HAD superfamily hydrolase (TIGR01459 family)